MCTARWAGSRVYQCLTTWRTSPLGLWRMPSWVAASTAISAIKDILASLVDWLKKVELDFKRILFLQVVKKIRGLSLLEVGKSRMEVASTRISAWAKVSLYLMAAIWSQIPILAKASQSHMEEGTWTRILTWAMVSPCHMVTALTQT